MWLFSKLLCLHAYFPPKANLKVGQNKFDLILKRDLSRSDSQIEASRPNWKPVE